MKEFFKRILQAIIFILVLPVLLLLFYIHVMLEVCIISPLVWIISGVNITGTWYINEMGCMGLFERRLRALFNFISQL